MWRVAQAVSLRLLEGVIRTMQLCSMCGFNVHQVNACRGYLG
ncbi:hypothetical protein VAE151_630559 [Vibrio aestuarianus]|nr:hypothetical protein VAE055_420559 [Vibrio aestuarianus]CAH8226608.1 hypothetical protein VAE128_500552 [Vibrio aestuarianus]CAH8227127.1 hypothetical protein VAE115_380035 [Vibrio aestuarianus]CAH8234546.1 hypothetical protein VAE142_930557 [Vibrio aestuarianus]CAH8237384.1 hypothetical protein VAE151_630559 [Vibrio aestuarianus]